VTPARFRHWALAGGITATLALFLLPLSNPVPTFDGIETDKVAHAGLIGALGFLLWWNLPGTRRRGTVAVLLAGAYAALIELIQSALPFRSGDVVDLAAGVIGAIAVVGVAGWWARRRGAGEAPSAEGPPN
jgi:VanZ family protein